MEQLNVLRQRAAEAVAGDSPPFPEYLSEQWRNPGDILSVLLLLGPDIVQRAIAQLAGRRITPVAFSFGWVSYAASALVFSVGDGSLMPPADVESTVVIGAQTGHARTTKSWVLGRLLRDFDSHVDDTIGEEEAHPSEQGPGPAAGSGGEKKGQIATASTSGSTATVSWEALRVTVFEVDPEPPAPHGVPTMDWVWFSGYLVIIAQLAIAIAPWISEGQWDVFMVTAIGNMLALAGGSLPQWTDEKWACPRKGGSTVTLTRGNGSRNAITILGTKGHGLDLEILASGTRTFKTSRRTRMAVATLALMWICLLITVSSMEEQTWYILGIGLLGSIQNVIAGGAPRKPGAFGLHLRHVDTIRGPKVARVLKTAEERYPGVGTSLLNVFFPGSLRVKDPEDLAFWTAALEERRKPNKFGTPLDQAM